MHQRLAGYANASALPPNKLDCLLLFTHQHLSYKEEAISVTSVKIAAYICVLRTRWHLLGCARNNHLSQVRAWSCSKNGRVGMSGIIFLFLMPLARVEDTASEMSPEHVPTVSVAVRGRQRCAFGPCLYFSPVVSVG